MFGTRNSKATTVVAREAHFEGTLELAGAVHVEGSFTGTLSAAGELSIGPEGVVVGKLSADCIVVAGRVEGTLVAKSQLRVLASGRVQGQTFYGSLEVLRGGTISGELTQGEPTLLGAGSERHEQQREESGVGPALPRLAEEGDATQVAGGR